MWTSNASAKRCGNIPRISGVELLLAHRMVYTCRKCLSWGTGDPS